MQYKTGVRNWCKELGGDESMCVGGVGVGMHSHH